MTQSMFDRRPTGPMGSRNRSGGVRTAEKGASREAAFTGHQPALAASIIKIYTEHSRHKYYQFDRAGSVLYFPLNFND